MDVTSDRGATRKTRVGCGVGMELLPQPFLENAIDESSVIASFHRAAKLVTFKSINMFAFLLSVLVTKIFQ